MGQKVSGLVRKTASIEPKAWEILERHKALGISWEALVSWLPVRRAVEHWFLTFTFLALPCSSLLALSLLLVFLFSIKKKIGVGEK